MERKTDAGVDIDSFGLLTEPGHADDPIYDIRAMLAYVEENGHPVPEDELHKFVISAR